MNNKYLHIHKWQIPISHYAKLIPIALFILTAIFFLFFPETANAENMSNKWSKLIENRSSLIYTESIDLGGLRIGGRGRIMFIWLDRSLMRVLQDDTDVDDSITNGLAYYYGNKRETAKLIKNKDVFLLSYQALKRWDFKIEEIVINGYRLSLDDILTPSYNRYLGEIAPLKMRERLAAEIATEDDDYDLDDYELYVAVPSMPKKGKVKLSYGDDTVEWEIPKK